MANFKFSQQNQQAPSTLRQIGEPVNPSQLVSSQYLEENSLRKTGLYRNYFKYYASPELKQELGSDKVELLSGKADKTVVWTKYEKRNLPPEALQAVHDMIFSTGAYSGGHKSMLDELGRALNVGQNVISGMFGKNIEVMNKKGDEHTAAGWSEFHKAIMSPVDAIQAIGAGFAHIPKAVSENETFTDVIKKNNDPNSWRYKYAMPIGLGMSVFFDPTTYLTFGALAGSKIAAESLLAEQTMKAYNEARGLIKAGQYAGDMSKVDEAAMDVTIKRGYAQDLGDAMDQIKTQAQQVKQEIRSTGSYMSKGLAEGEKSTPLVKATLKQKAGAWLLPTNVKGGRGVRFAGMEIPGSAKVTEGIASSFNKAMVDSKTGQFFGNALIPAWTARHIQGDKIRASVLVEMSKFTSMKKMLAKDISEEVRGLHKVSVGAKAIEDPYAIKMAEDGSATLEHAGGGAEMAVSIKPEERMGLMQTDVTKLQGPLKVLRERVNEEADVAIENAVKQGATKSLLVSSWDKLAQHYNDPLEALFDFKLRAATEGLSAEFTNHILSDARFSLPLAPKTEQAIAKADTDYQVALEAISSVKGESKEFYAAARDEAHGEWMAAKGKAAKGKALAGPGTSALTEVPAGFTEFSRGGKTFAVRDAVAYGLREINNPNIQGEASRRFFKVVEGLNKPTLIWKKYATSPNPAFHVMNVLGASWNNALAGVYNPINYVDAAALVYKANREQAAQLGERFGILGKIPEATQEGKAALKKFQEAETRSATGSASFIASDQTYGAFDRETVKELKTVGGGGPKSRLGKLAEKPAGMSRARFVLKRGRQGAAMAALAPGGVAAPIGLMLMAPEMAKVGRKWGQYMEDMVRLAPFEKESKDIAVRRALHTFGPIHVDDMEYPRFSRSEQQIMYDIGAGVSKHFQFDYSDLTPFERWGAKTIFPFWTFFKKNFALQFHEALSQPRKVGTTLKVMNYINENSGQDIGPYKALLPQYFDDLQAFQIGVPDWARKKLGLPADEPLYLNPKLPFVQLNLMPNLWDILRDGNMSGPQKIRDIISTPAGMIGPFAPVPVPGAKMLLEAGTGYNLGMNSPIDYAGVTSAGQKQSTTVAPGWAQYLPKALQGFFGMYKSPKDGQIRMGSTAAYVLNTMSLPFINNAGKTISTPGGSEAVQGKARADMVSWMTGIRLMPVDTLRLSRNEGYTVLNVINAKKSELKAKGKTLSFEDQSLLIETSAWLRVINAAYDKREGYGQ